MKKTISTATIWTFIAVYVAVIGCVTAASEPPAMNPFGSRQSVRDDARPGYVELSDGTVHCGMIHMTRDKRLKIKDDKIGRQREVPLRVVSQIDGIVKKEWMEKEWRFKELALDEKMYTGRKYPAREYLHEITLHDGRKIQGPMAEIIYLKPDPSTGGKKSATTPRSPKQKTERFTLYKRDKGKPGTILKDLIYVKRIKLGDEALEEGRKKARKNMKKDDRRQRTERRPDRDPASS